MDVIDRNLKDMKALRVEKARELNMLDKAIDALEPFATTVHEKAKPELTLVKSPRSTKRKAAARPLKRRKRRDIKGPAMQMLAEHPIQRGELIRRLGGDSSAFRTVKQLIDKNVVQFDEETDTVSLKTEEPAATTA